MGKSREVTTLRVMSGQAQNTETLMKDLAAYVAKQAGLETIYVDDIDWRDRYRALFDGRIHVGWICGLPYVRHVDGREATIELLAVPVMEGIRYGGRPVYFSDVVVRSDSPYYEFSDLRQATWAINETNSHSGCGVVVYALATQGLDWSFFCRVVESGSHAESLKLILRGEATASAIDSTYLEWAMQRDRGLAAMLRVIETLGPSPIPPLVVGRHLSPTLKATLQDLLTRMHQTQRGRSILYEGGLQKFVQADDSLYDPIRRMERSARENS